MLKDPNAKRDKAIQVKFYVSENEKQLIEQKFEESEMPSRRSFYLCSILGNPIYIIDQTPVKEHTWELNKIGVNFNQLVKKLKSQQDINPQDIETVKAYMKAVFDCENRFIQGYIKLRKSNIKP